VAPFLSAAALVYSALALATLRSSITGVLSYAAVIVAPVADLGTFILLVGHIEPPHQSSFTLGDKG
jgi:hypothetical protein